MPSAIDFKVTPGPNASVQVVSLIGELDETGLDPIGKTVEPLMDRPELKTLVIDLSGLSFINSKGIGYLVFLQTHLTRDKKKLVMAGAREEVMDVISLVGLTGIIPYFESVQDALAHSA